MNLAICLLCIILIPFAIAGLALIHQGLGRSRSAAHAMLATLCAIAIAAIVFTLVGFSFTGLQSNPQTTQLAPSHVLQLAGKHWDWLGAQPLLAGGLHSDLLRSPYAALALAFEIFAVGLTAIIPISAGTDRFRLIAICASTALLAAILFPLFAHWVWASGWLATLTTLFGIPAFKDLGGSGVIHALGGLTALSIAWILGPRKGKYTDGMATAIPGHNIVQVLFGCLLALVGWIGLNAAASILFYGISVVEVIAIVINAILTASAGCLAAVLTTQIRYRKPDASLSANGWIAGLVAGSAGAGLLTPAAAILTGLVAGLIVTLLVEALELKLFIDDPGGAISIHAGAGLWGLLAFGIFGPTAGPRLGLVLAQLIGIATLLGLMLPLIHGCHLLLNRFLRFRVDRDGDWQGMDIRELGAGAYPEFVIHADEFVPR
jgi:Amt family ammonium transporter